MILRTSVISSDYQLLLPMGQGQCMIGAVTEGDGVTGAGGGVKLEVSASSAGIRRFRIIVMAAILLRVDRAGVFNRLHPVMRRSGEEGIK